MGRAAAPLFAPLGFGDWRAVSAIIAGVTAKEAVVSTLAIMAGNPVGSIEMTQMLTEKQYYSVGPRKTNKDCCQILDKG